MWGVRRRDRHRRAVPDVRTGSGATGSADRAPGGDGDDAAARGLRRVESSDHADRPARGSGECAAVVCADVSHCQTHSLGVAEMNKWVVSGAWGVVAMLVAMPLAGQTSLSIYRDGDRKSTRLNSSHQIISY